jgi:hypothetical protein
MVGSASHKGRVFTKFEFEGRHNKVAKPDWRKLEKLWGVSLPEEARSKLDIANRLYAAVGPTHSGKGTVSVVAAKNALANWIKASGRLRKALGARTTSAPVLTKAEIVQKFYGTAAVKKIGKMKTLTFVQYVTEVAIGAAELGLKEIDEFKLSPELESDLWLAWAAFASSVAKGAGAKISASSSNKTANESPFVVGLSSLQELLPAECQRRNGYDSIAKGVQDARKKFGQTSPDALLAIIAAWGAGIPGFGEYNPAETEAFVRKFLSQNHTKGARKKGAPTSRPS